MNILRIEDIRNHVLLPASQTSSHQLATWTKIGRHPRLEWPAKHWTVPMKWAILQPRRRAHSNSESLHNHSNVAEHIAVMLRAGRSYKRAENSKTIQVFSTAVVNCNYICSWSSIYPFDLRTENSATLCVAPLHSVVTSLWKWEPYAQETFSPRMMRRGQVEGRFSGCCH